MSDLYCFKIKVKKTSEAKKLLVIRGKIGEKIRQRRRYASMETKVLAMKVGLSQGSISNIETGKQAITAERLWQFAVALKCSINELLPPIPDEVRGFDENLRKIENEQAKEFAKDIINNL